MELGTILQEQTIMYKKIWWRSVFSRFHFPSRLAEFHINDYSFPWSSFLRKFHWQ